MKKTYLLILILFINPVSAHEMSVLPVSDVCINETFNVGITINGSNMSGASFDLLFDKNMLEALSIAEGDFIKNSCAMRWGFSVSKINNSIGKIKFQDLCFGSYMTGNGSILEITFKIKSIENSRLNLENANIFDYPGGDTIPGIGVKNGSVNYASCCFINNNCSNNQTCNTINHTCQNLNCSQGYHPQNHSCVLNIRPGDSNGDGSVNIFDVIWAEKIAVGLQGPSVGNADADCNGVVNIFDVIWIEKIAVGLPGKC